jgi:hypothetical protein
VFVDKDKNVVGENDPAKLTKVVSVGDSIPRADAEKYGLLASASEAETLESKAVKNEPPKGKKTDKK